MSGPSREFTVLAPSPGVPAEASLDKPAARRARLAVYSRLSGLDHPYFRLMHRALERGGVSITGDVEIGVSWLRSNRGSIDAVHFHWPETIWNARGSEPRHVVTRAMHSARALLQVSRFLREARRLGITRVWTIHNVEPHEGASVWDRLGYRLFARSTDIVVSHSASSLKEVQRHYGITARTVVMPIGALHGAFPPPRSRDVVMAELGMNPHLPMVCCIGRLRGYKGLDLACAAIKRLNGQVQFVAAGAPHPGFDVGRLQDSIARIPRSMLLARKLSDQEFADIIAASDAVLLPYRQVTGSAVLLAALGFGRAVIAANLPYLHEILAAEPDAAALVASSNPAAWAEAVTAVLSRPAGGRQEAAPQARRTIFVGALHRAVRRGARRRSASVTARRQNATYSLPARADTLSCFAPEGSLLLAETACRANRLPCK